MSVLVTFSHPLLSVFTTTVPILIIPCLHYCISSRTSTCPVSLRGGELQINLPKAVHWLCHSCSDCLISLMTTFRDFSLVLEVLHYVWPKWPISCFPDLVSTFSSLWLFSVPSRPNSIIPYSLSFPAQSIYLWTFNIGAFLGYLSQNSSSYKVVEVIIMSLKIVFPQPNYKLVEGQYSHVFEISQQSSDFLLQ